MRKFFGIVFMLLGMAMIVGSGWLIYGNKTENETAGNLSEAALVQMRSVISTAPKVTFGTKDASDPAVVPEFTAAAESLEPMVTAAAESLEPMVTPAPMESTVPVSDEELPAATPIPEMPTIQIDGHDYIGYLEIPTIGVSLPVMSDWSYPKLRIAPCRYWGSAYDDSLVIMAHNYDRHFGNISVLEIGAPVQFIDADGNIFRYVVAAHEQLERTGVDEMIAEPWDLTLFTCTYGGAKRITVRLNRVDAFAVS